MQRGERYGTILFAVLCICTLAICVWRSRTVSERISRRPPSPTEFVELSVGEPRIYRSASDSTGKEKKKAASTKKRQKKDKAGPAQDTPAPGRGDWLDNL